jgi:group I intron endonuclease
MAFIYKITNPNGRIYIGQTTDLDTRWDRYKKLQCKDQPSIYSSLCKYGPENHKFDIIEECPESILDEREIYWGEQYDVLSNKHLNNRLGRGFGSYDSEETKIKKSLCHKGRSNYWLKGKPLSEDHKNKISKAKKGKKLPHTKVRKDKGSTRRYHVESVIKAKSLPIIQYSKEGNFIKEWFSGKEASKELNIPQPNINSCCNNKIKTAGGYVWKFKDMKI